MNSSSQPVFLRESEIETTICKLLAYCSSENWAGYDPYDALNSKVFQWLPILNSRIPRLVLTQALKRSPVNLRRLLRIPKAQNPKAIALFLRGFLQLDEMHPGRHEEEIQLMIDRLVALRSSDTQYWCWGYTFPWQGRHVVVPRSAPNLVCTTFVAGALLDRYERSRDRELLAMALSAAEYILNELYWEETSAAGFSYPLRSLKAEIHNANFLAAALFCRVYSLTGESKFIEPALRAARYSASKQQSDGSWYYGESANQRWIDNFHTGYNLSALEQIDKSLGTEEFEKHIDNGFQFYKAHFFREDGAARYFHNRTYPIDIHCVAQSILSLLEFQHRDSGNLPLASEVVDWTMKHMWDDRGFFYYRMLRSCTIRTSYMRWSQAWMFLALATLQREIHLAERGLQSHESLAVVQ